MSDDHLAWLFGRLLILAVAIFALGYVLGVVTS